MSAVDYMLIFAIVFFIASVVYSVRRINHPKEPKEGEEGCRIDINTAPDASLITITKETKDG